MSVAFRVRVHIHSSSVFMINVPLNLNISLDISSFAGEEHDLGGDDCEEAESKSSAQLMSDTSDPGDLDSIGFLASLELQGLVEWRQ